MKYGHLGLINYNDQLLSSFGAVERADVVNYDIMETYIPGEGNNFYWDKPNQEIIVPSVTGFVRNFLIEAKIFVQGRLESRFAKGDSFTLQVFPTIPTNERPKFNETILEQASLGIAFEHPFMQGLGMESVFSMSSSIYMHGDPDYYSLGSTDYFPITIAGILAIQPVTINDVNSSVAIKVQLLNKCATKKTISGGTNDPWILGGYGTKLSVSELDMIPHVSADLTEVPNGSCIGPISIEEVRTKVPYNAEGVSDKEIEKSINYGRTRIFKNLKGMGYTTQELNEIATYLSSHDVVLKQLNGSNKPISDDFYKTEQGVIAMDLDRTGVLRQAAELDQQNPSHF